MTEKIIEGLSYLYFIAAIYVFFTFFHTEFAKVAVTFSEVNSNLSNYHSETSKLFKDNIHSLQVSLEEVLTSLKQKFASDSVKQQQYEQELKYLIIQNAKLKSENEQLQNTITVLQTQETTNLNHISQLESSHNDLLQSFQNLQSTHKETTSELTRAKQLNNQLTVDLEEQKTSSLLQMDSLTQKLTGVILFYFILFIIY